MSKISNKIVFLFCMLACSAILHAQHTKIYNSHIKTVQVIANEDSYFPPVIELNSDEFIELSFDELSHDYHRYQYVLTHCNADWTPSDLSEIDYLDGFNNNPIDNYELSINTTMPYTHYYVRFPNDVVRMTLSGNYLVSVYDDSDTENPVFQTGFSVIEKRVHINTQVTSNTEIDHNKNHQQVNFCIQYADYNIRNPQQEVKVHVMQNRRMDNAKFQLVPTYISPTELRYEHSKSLIFNAGNEYRRFECVSKRYANLNVDYIQYHNPFYHVALFEDQFRGFNYSFDEDQNGRYLIRYDQATDQQLEADYFFVHFQLKASKPFHSGKLYLQGDFTNNAFQKEFEMKYNAQNQTYESVQLLKQGAYNYQYIYVPHDSEQGYTQQVEGDFHETENEYLILVYHRPFGERYDKLIGLQQIKFQ